MSVDPKKRDKGADNEESSIKKWSGEETSQKGSDVGSPNSPLSPSSSISASLACFPTELLNLLNPANAHQLCSAVAARGPAALESTVNAMLDCLPAIMADPYHCATLAWVLPLCSVPQRNELIEEAAPYLGVLSLHNYGHTSVLAFLNSLSTPFQVRQATAALNPHAGNLVQYHLGQKNHGHLYYEICCS
eukprot:TRINITY_DN10316_c0_g1_i1.p1 TRINITY_DN10316_c0_g1~~TRINITY_DN10316_c0_g1_i1.p1  ORF type:complete len:190 (-),score=22.21 TRINITY_DN10316_c0_g1_i1:377-946(-)